MSSVVQNLLDNAIGDGARNSKFECMINFNGTGLYTKENDMFALVKTSQFPGKTHEVMDFKFKGRSIPLKGQTKYEGTWACTFYLTQDHELKKAFEDWIESLDQQHNLKKVSAPVRAAQAANNSGGYTGTMKIAQMDFHGSQQTAVYELAHCFPKSVTGVDVDYATVGSILEFTVEFSYAYYKTLTQKVAGSFVDDAVNAARAKGENLVSDMKNGMAALVGSALPSGSVASMGNPPVGAKPASAEINTFSSTKAADMVQV